MAVWMGGVGWQRQAPAAVGCFVSPPPKVGRDSFARSNGVCPERASRGQWGEVVEHANSLDEPGTRTCLCQRSGMDNGQGGKAAAGVIVENIQQLEWASNDWDSGWGAGVFGGASLAPRQNALAAGSAAHRRPWNWSSKLGRGCPQR